MHDGMLYGRNQGQGQGHSREVDRQSPTGLIFMRLSSLGGGRIMCRTLSVRLSVPLSLPSVTSRHLANYDTHILFRTR